MNRTIDKNLDLELNRIIKAPRSAVWAAMDRSGELREMVDPCPGPVPGRRDGPAAGGALITEIDESGTGFTRIFRPAISPSMPDRQLVFTNA